MPTEVRVPSLGESIQEAVVARWTVGDGEAVRADEKVLELETDKANVEIVAERSGTLKILKQEGETVRVGEVVGLIEVAAAADTPRPMPQSRPESRPEAGSRPESTRTDPILSPSARKLAAEHGLEAAMIQGSGRGGRVTQRDVLRHLESARRAPAEVDVPAPAPSPAREVPAGAEEERVPMTPVRRRIAERLVQAQHTAAILTTFNEVDMTAVVEWRTRHKQRFAEVHGASLGFVSFFARACVGVLREMPIVNAQIDGDDIVYKKHVNLGIAVSSERGLVVPVVHRAEEMTFPEIEKEIGRLARLAREGRLTIADLSGGTFTITNGGVFGSLLSTPILNPPQSAILGMHKIEKRPVVVGDEIAIRPMMYLALSYDHRLIDGEQAVTFLVRVKERIEDPARLLLEV
jgi:2-oxoglutarate dehydrogenase E2 component (dihydrolipoamide succinyltransferase)